MIKLKDSNLKIMWSYDEVPSKGTGLSTIQTTCKLFTLDGEKPFATANVTKSVEDAPDKNKARKLSLRKVLLEAFPNETDRAIRAAIWEAYFFMRTITVPAQEEKTLVRY